MDDDAVCEAGEGGGPGGEGGVFFADEDAGCDAADGGEGGGVHGQGVPFLAGEEGGRGAGWEEVRGEGEVDLVLEGGDHGVDGAGEVGADEVDYVGVVVAEEGLEDEALGGLAFFEGKEMGELTSSFAGVEFAIRSGILRIAAKTEGGRT